MTTRKQAAKAKRGVAMKATVRAAAGPVDKLQIYNRVEDCVKVHFDGERAATPVNEVYPQRSIWRARADLIAECVKKISPYYNHMTQEGLAMAIAAMHERTINSLIFGIYQMRHGG